MISNSVISFVCVVILCGTLCAAASSDRVNAVHSVARVNDTMVQHDGAVYNLIAIKCDPNAMGPVGATTSFDVLLNGRSVAEQLPGTAALPSFLQLGIDHTDGTIVTWARLPRQEENVELVGAVSFLRPPPGMSQRIPASVKPYVQRAGEIPIIQVQSNDEIGFAMSRLAGVEKAETRPAARPVARWQVIQGVAIVQSPSSVPSTMPEDEQHTLALRFDTDVLGYARGSLNVAVFINGRATTNLSGMRCPGTHLIRAEVPPKGKLEILAGHREESDRGSSPDEVRSALLARGYVPLVVEVEQIPTIKANDVFAAAAAMDKILPLKYRQRTEWQVITDVRQVAPIVRAQDDSVLVIRYDPSVHDWLDGRSMLQLNSNHMITDVTWGKAGVCFVRIKTPKNDEPVRFLMGLCESNDIYQDREQLRDMLLKRGFRDYGRAVWRDLDLVQTGSLEQIAAGSPSRMMWPHRIYPFIRSN